MLRQGFPHCAIFLTAAPRRSRNRVSVPVWLVFLSEQLSIIALVGLYPTNQLIDRRPLLKRLNFPHQDPSPVRLCGISHSFPWLSPASGQVTYVLRTRSPLSTDRFSLNLRGPFPVRLACVKHAASVHPEPGSNSPYFHEYSQHHSGHRSYPLLHAKRFQTLN